MADALFNRKVRIIVGDRLVEDLRVRFTVRKSNTKEPNTLSAEVFNLAEKSRAALKEKGVRIILEAGYETTLAQVFAGDARTVDHLHEGPNWVTKIECGDGEKSYRYRKVNESFRAGTAVADVFSKVTSQAELDVREAVAFVRQVITEQFTQGYVAAGPVSAELDRLLKGRGFEWSIQDGRLQVTQAGQPTKDSAVLLSPSTGLVGSPAHGAPEEKGGPAVLRVRSLLQPSLTPGRKVLLDAAGLKGLFRVVKVTHSGDTHGPEWLSDLECLPVS